MLRNSLMITGALALALSAFPHEIVVDYGKLAVKQTQAHAGNGNGNSGDHGNGNGNGNGKGGGNGNGGATGIAAPGASQVSASNSGKSGHGFGKGGKKGFAPIDDLQMTFNKHGKLTGQARADFARNWASVFGRLNAFQAAMPAFRNSNGQPGRINDYMEASKELAIMQPALEQEIQDQMDDLLAMGLTEDDIARFSEMTEEEVLAELEKAVEEQVPEEEIADGTETGTKEKTAQTQLDTEAVLEALKSMSETEQQLADLQQAADNSFYEASGGNTNEGVREKLDEMLSYKEQ